MTDPSGDWVETGSCPRCGRRLKVYGEYVDPEFTDGLLWDFSDVKATHVERICDCDMEPRHIEAIEESACMDARERARKMIYENKHSFREDQRR